MGQIITLYYNLFMKWPSYLKAVQAKPCSATFGFLQAGQSATPSRFGSSSSSSSVRAWSQAVCSVYGMQMLTLVHCCRYLNEKVVCFTECFTLNCWPLYKHTRREHANKCYSSINNQNTLLWQLFAVKKACAEYSVKLNSGVCCLGHTRKTCPHAAKWQFHIRCVSEKTRHLTVDHNLHTFATFTEWHCAAVCDNPQLVAISVCHITDPILITATLFSRSFRHEGIDLGY